MHGVTPEGALRAVMNIKPEDVAKIKEEEVEAAKKREGKRKEK